MPLPLIPALLIAGSAISGVVGVKKAVDANDEINEYREWYDSVRDEYDEKYSELEAVAQEITPVIEELENEQERSQNLFMLFEKKFSDQKFSVNRIFDTMDVSMSQKTMGNETKEVSLTDILYGAGQSVFTGASTAAGTYGLVGMFGAASTGTAISSLSGIVASNANLSVLGGGALSIGGGGMALGTTVMGGLLAGPAILTAGFFAASKAEEIKTAVCKAVAELEVAQENLNSEILNVEAQLELLKEILETVQNLNDRIESFLYSGTEVSEDLLVSFLEAFNELYEVLIDNGG